MSDAAMAEIILTIDNVSKSFPEGTQAVKNFAAEIRRQEVVVIMGPSGSGKSTLLRCINGLEEADGGTIVVDGIPLDADKGHRLEIRKEVGMVFQSFNLFPHLTALENVNLAQVRVRKRTKAEAIRQSMGCCARWASATRPTAIRRSSPGGSSSGSLSPAPWRCGPR